MEEYNKYTGKFYKFFLSIEIYQLLNDNYELAKSHKQITEMFDNINLSLNYINKKIGILICFDKQFKPEELNFEFVNQLVNLYMDFNNVVLLFIKNYELNDIFKNSLNYFSLIKAFLDEKSEIIIQKLDSLIRKVL